MEQLVLIQEVGAYSERPSTTNKTARRSISVAVA